MLTNFCFVVLVSDLDKDIFFLFKNSGFPTLLIWLSSQKILQTNLSSEALLNSQNLTIKSHYDFTKKRKLD